MIIDIPNGKDIGQWSRVLVDEFGDRPRWGAIIRCPDCDERLAVVNHAISADGQVTPSVGHPIRATCTWHVSPKLLGWAPCPPAPDVKPYEECRKCHTKARQLDGWGIGWGFDLICQSCIEDLGA